MRSESEESGGEFGAAEVIITMRTMNPGLHGNFDDNDSSSEAMDEYLERRIRSPLNENFDDDEGDSVMISDTGMKLHEEVDFPDYTPNEEELSFLNDLPKLVKGDNSSSSEVTVKQKSDQTHPETPPSPMRSESRQSVHSSSSGSSIAVNQTFVFEEQPPPRIQSRSPAESSSYHITSFNPMTCHSPIRKMPARREIMGMSIVTNARHEQKTADHPPLQSVHSDDDSEAALEMAAQLIRRELWNSEIMELAAEAEKAAEAGEDRFAAQPCVFQDDMDFRRRKPVSMHTQTPVRRSFSEGTHLPISRPQRRRKSTTTDIPLGYILSSHYNDNQYNKLSVVELRDVNEVFPSFRQFHTHLRTHFFRSKVSQDQLMFREVAPSDEKQQTLSLHRSFSFCKGVDSIAATILPAFANENGSTLISARKLLPKTSRIDEMQANFLRTFSLDQWSAPHKSWASTGTSTDDVFDDSSFLGDLLSEHISTGPPPIPRKIEVPLGMDTTIDRSFTARSLPKVNHRNRGDGNGEDDQRETVDTANTPYNYPKICQVRSLPSSLEFCTVEPRALFDSAEYDSCDEIDGRIVHLREPLSRSATTPETEQTQTNGLKHFESIDKSHNSLLDESALLSIPRLDGRTRKSSAFVATRIDESSKAIPTMIPDFVTPARLRKIRGTRKAISDASLKPEGSDLLLPTNSLAEESKVIPDMKSRRSPHPHPNTQMPLLETVLDISDSFTINESKECSTIIFGVHSLQNVKEEFKGRDVTEVTSVECVAIPLDDLIMVSSVSEGLPVDLISKVPGPVLTSDSTGLYESFTPARHRRTIPAKMTPRGLKEKFGQVVLQAPLGFNTLEDVSDSMLQTQQKPQHADATMDLTATPGESWPLQPAVDFPITPYFPGRWDVVRSLPSSPVSTKNEEFFKKKLTRSLGNQGKTPRTVQLSIYIVPDRNKSQSDRPEALHHAIVISSGNEKSTSRCQNIPPLVTSENQECSCLSLSPAATSNSEEESDKDDTNSHEIATSTSTGALHDPRSWNAFIDSYDKSKSTCRHAAINMFSKQRNNKDEQRALYTRTKENDDFMNNYMYCSKPAEKSEHQVGKVHSSEACDGYMTCGDADSGYCCTSIFHDVLTLGIFFPPRKHAPYRNLVKVSNKGVAAPKQDPQSWFDLASERFDGARHWVGGGHHKADDLNVSFQAPSLKKTGSRSTRTGLIGPVITDDDIGGDDEINISGGDLDGEEFDSDYVYDIDNPHNSRRSLYEGPHETRRSFIAEDSDTQISIHEVRVPALSDKQLELINVISKKSFEA